MVKPQTCVITFLFEKPLFCLFCGRRNVDTLDDPTPLSPCPHVQFIATDELYIFTSKTFECKRPMDSDNGDDELFIDRILNMGSTSD